METNPIDQINQALALHRSGRSAEADALLAQVLATEPDNCEALYVLGGIRLERAAPTDALLLLERAAALAPDSAPIQLARGLALAATGRMAEGVASLERAIALDPANPQAYDQLGALFLRLGSLEDAAAVFERAVTALPCRGEGFRHLGGALRALGRLEEAVACFQRALTLNPNDADAATYLADALEASGAAAEAARIWEIAARLQPQNPDIQEHLAAALRVAGALEASVAAYRRALALRPDEARLHNNLGFLLKSLGESAEAIAAFREAVALSPQAADTHNNLGAALYEAGQFREALVHLERAATLDARFRTARFHLWNAQLLLGEYAAGWPNYAWWMAQGTYNPRAFSPPLWEGQAIPDGTLLVYADHGFGDAIQMARYLPAVRDRVGGRVALECPPELVRLFEAASLADVVIARRPDNAAPDLAFDARIGLMSLPGLFATVLDTIPARISYLTAPEPTRAAWRERFGDDGRLRVGIRWAGNPDHVNDANRSLPPRLLEPLSRIADVRLFLLQENPEVLKQWPAPRERTLGDLSERPADFLETAAVMANLDLIITVDTAVAHLAGALGVPCWTLLPFVPDWRWGAEREDAPWYARMTLFRQRLPGDWPEVIARVAAALEAMARQGTTDYA